MQRLTIESPTLRELYPDLEDEDIASTAEALDRYIGLIARITERIAQDQEAMPQYRSLTHAAGLSTMTEDPMESSDH